MQEAFGSERECKITPCGLQIFKEDAVVTMVHNKSFPVPNCSYRQEKWYPNNLKVHLSARRGMLPRGGRRSIAIALKRLEHGHALFLGEVKLLSNPIDHGLPTRVDAEVIKSHLEIRCVWLYLHAQNLQTEASLFILSLESPTLLKEQELFEATITATESQESLSFQNRVIGNDSWPTILQGFQNVSHGRLIVSFEHFMPSYPS